MTEEEELAKEVLDRLKEAGTGWPDLTPLLLLHAMIMFASFMAGLLS